jgi:hypothetical protein
VWHQLVVDRERAHRIRLDTIAEFERLSKEDEDAAALLTKAKKRFRNRRGGMKKQHISADAASEVDAE